MAAIEPLWCQHPLFPWTQLQFRLHTDMYSMYVHSIDSEFILNRFRGLIMIGLVLWYATVTVGCNHNTHPALHSTCKALTLHSGAVTSSTLCKWTRSIKTVCSPVYIQLLYVCIYWPEGWVHILPCKLLMPSPPSKWNLWQGTLHRPKVWLCRCNNLCASFETAIPVPPGEGGGSVGGVPCMHAHTACYSALVQAIRSPCWHWSVK